MALRRQALDSDRVRAWLGANRPGHRFWFGRYTGWTPISGSPQRDTAEAELRTELRRQSSLAQRVAGTDAQRFFPRFNSEERRVGTACVSTCRSRWSTYTYKKQQTTHT